MCTADTGDEEAVQRWKDDLMKYTKLTPEDFGARVRDALCAMSLVSGYWIYIYIERESEREIYTVTAIRL